MQLEREDQVLDKNTAVHLDEDHSKTANANGVHVEKLLSSLMTAYDRLKVNL